MDAERFESLLRSLSTSPTRRTTLGLLGTTVLGGLLPLGLQPARAKKGKGTGKKPPKITICHSGQTIRINKRALPAHFRHGDTFGRCPTTLPDGPTIKTQTFFPTSGAGRVLNLNQPTFAAARNANTGNFVGTGEFSLRAFQNAPSDWSIHRIFLPFDTTSLTASATILAATLQIYRDDNLQPFANADGVTIRVVPTNQASNTTLTMDDFDRVTFASKGSFDLASMLDGAFNNVPITDLSVINRTGMTRIGAILSNDLNNGPLTGDNGFSGANPNAPRLVVTFQVP